MLSPAEASWAHLVLKGMAPAPAPLLTVVRGSPQPSTARDQEWEFIQPHLERRPLYLCNKSELTEIAKGLNLNPQDPNLRTRAQLEEAIKATDPQRAPKGARPKSSSTTKPIGLMKTEELHEECRRQRIDSENLTAQEMRLALQGWTPPKPMRNDFDDEDTPLCPRCEKVMIRRENRLTAQLFWGCSDFPECRGTLAWGTRRVHQTQSGPKTWDISSSPGASTPCSRVTGTMDTDLGMSKTQNRIMRGQLKRVSKELDGRLG